jgi:hypothetical protein
MIRAKTIINLEETILDFDSASENEKPFTEEQKDKSKISEELAKEYFKSINTSVLPF